MGGGYSHDPVHRQHEGQVVGGQADGLQDDGDGDDAPGGDACCTDAGGRGRYPGNDAELVTTTARSRVGKTRAFAGLTGW